MQTFSWLATLAPKAVWRLAVKPASEARVTSKKEHPQVVAGMIREMMVAIKKPMSPTMNRKTQEKYIRYRHPYLSQQAVKRAPRRAKNPKPMKTP